MPQIHNDHNVYILGAGFSAARGLPLIKHFMCHLRDAHQWLTDQNRSTEANAVRDVLDFRLKSTPAAYRVQIDLENIEELFSLASAVDDSLTNAICIAIAATLDYRAAIIPAPHTQFNLEIGAPLLPQHIGAKIVNEGISINASRLQMPTYQFILAGLLGRLNPGVQRMTNCIITSTHCD